MSARQAALVALLLFIPAVLAVELRSARVDEGLSRIHADLHIRLPERAKQALEHGIALSFELEVRGRFEDLLARRERRLLKRSARLRLDPLVRRYVLEYDGRDPRPYARLNSALDALGELRGVEIQRLPAHAQRRSYRLRLMLDRAALPGPLKLEAYFTSGFALDTGWLAIAEGS